MTMTAMVKQLRRTLMLLAAFPLAGLALAQSTQPAPQTLDFGTGGLIFPPVVVVNAHVPRTAELLGVASQRQDAPTWVRSQYVAELGETGLPAAARYLIDAMKDPSAEIRAQGARSAGEIADEPSLRDAVEKLLADSDASVRREAVLSAAKLARANATSTAAIDRALADSDLQVVAAGLQAAWTPQHASAIAGKIATLPPARRADAALALGRLKSPESSSAIVPLLSGEVRDRSAALRALGEIGDKSQAAAVIKLLADAHPSVRREAVIAMGKLADDVTRQSRAIEMLKDADLTVREAAARVLTPVESTVALVALLAQLGEDYAPLHATARDALAHPADAAIKQATIDAAVKLLADANPRRREDASFILGCLKSAAAFEQHVALLKWNAQDPKQTDWPVVAQAAESLGLIGDARAGDSLMALIKPAPDSVNALQRPQRDDMARATSNAMIACARLHYTPALTEAIRILGLDPGSCPSQLRAASAFAVGMLTDVSQRPIGFNLLGIYGSQEESKMTKFEAIKALGNLGHAGSAERLRSISDAESDSQMRWIAHWSADRAAGTTTPYTPSTAQRQPAVSISDLPAK